MQSFQESQRYPGAVTSETQLCADQGLSIKIEKGLTQEFSVNHGINIAQANPLAGMVPNQPPTKPSHISWGASYNGVDTSGPVPVQTCAFNTEISPSLSKNFLAESEINNSAIFIQSLSKQKRAIYRWMFGQTKTSGISLCDELSCSVSSENYNIQGAISRPDFMSPSGLKFEGVFIASMLGKIMEGKFKPGDSINLGGQLVLQRMAPPPMMGGGPARNQWKPVIGLEYNHQDVKTHFLSRPKDQPSVTSFSDHSKELLTKAKTQAFFDVPMSGSPWGLTLQHHVTGGPVNNNTDLYAEVSIGQDPTPVQYGGTGGKQITGFIAQKVNFKDPTAPKPAPGHPPARSIAEMRTKLTTEGEVTMSAELGLMPLPARGVLKWSYNMMKDTMKIGAGFNIGGPQDM